MAEVTFTKKMDDLQPTYGADQTIEFAFEGVQYSIDLCNRNAETFKKKFEKYVKAATVKKVTPNISPTPREQYNARPGLIRDWAKTQGMYVNPNGHVPRDVEEAYDNYQKLAKSVLQNA